MTEEFDKEIDSLLRRAAKGESVQAFDAHMDADEVSLFAENALTAKARARAAEHLAECAKCRKILSHLISFDAEPESETIHAEQSDIIPVAPAIPWYRRLFAFPQITFAMGALALVFAGIIAVMVLQTANDSQNVSVARREEIRETSRGTSGASDDGAAQTVETYSGNMSNSTSVNPGMMSNSNTSATSAVSNTTSANTTLADKESQPALPRQLPPPEAAKNEPQKPLTLSEAQPANPADLNKTTETVTVAPAPKDSQQRQTEEDAKELSARKSEKERAALNVSPKSSDNTPSTLGAQPKKRVSEDKNKADEARFVGGRTFRQTGGVWVDSAYTSQPQIMIRRGSDDYKRLDSGLRSIAESLSGTVVVLWKSKAYRIN